MKITDLLKRESVELSGTPESKGQAIDQMVELMAKGGNINDLQRYKRALKNIGFVNFIFKGIRNSPVSNQVLVDFLNSV